MSTATQAKAKREQGGVVRSPRTSPSIVAQTSKPLTLEQTVAQVLAKSDLSDPEVVAALVKYGTGAANMERSATSRAKDAEQREQEAAKIRKEAQGQAKDATVTLARLSYALQVHARVKGTTLAQEWDMTGARVSQLKAIGQAMATLAPVKGTTLVRASDRDLYATLESARAKGARVLAEVVRESKDGRVRPADHLKTLTGGPAKPAEAKKITSRLSAILHAITVAPIMGTLEEQQALATMAQRVADAAAAAI